MTAAAGIGLTPLVVPVRLLWHRSRREGGASIADTFWGLGTHCRTWPTQCFRPSGLQPTNWPLRFRPASGESAVASSASCAAGASRRTTAAAASVSRGWESFFTSTGIPGLLT
jgi:hypothetical protein